MEITEIQPFFLGRLVQTTHLTSSQTNEAGLSRLLDYRTAVRRYRGQDLEVGLMALAAAQQLGMESEALGDWIRRYCERVLRHPEAQASVRAMLDSVPTAGLGSEIYLAWYEAVLVQTSSLVRP